MAIIAVLGWGSLLWDKRAGFDEFHGAWEPGGPELHIEFSRISSTRAGALTLVIDPMHGSVCRVSYALSSRQDPEDAIADLMSREGTTRRNIGYYFTDENVAQARDAATLDTVKTWAQTNGIDITIWSDLRSNFEMKTGRPFSSSAAVAHIRSLSPEGRAAAAAYVGHAPAFVQTPIRAELEAAPWFKL